MKRRVDDGKGRLRALIAVAAMLTLVDSAYSADVPEAVLKAEQDRIAVVARVTKPTVAVFSGDGNGGGSGVVISPDGYALTNYHVTSPVGDYMKCGMSDGKIYDAVIVGIDPTGDVALIKLFGRDDFPVAELGDSDKVRVGDWAIVVGNPFLLATNLQPTVTYGIVSGVHRYQPPAGTLLEYADCIQTDASINPGNSGGPLFNADGQLIGINGRGSFEKRGRVNVGVGYAISINQIKHFLGYLHSGRIVDHATLGATVDDAEDGRVVVSNILSSSDAFRRGLRYGDELISFGGRRITTPNGFKNVLGIYPKGWLVPLSYRRRGERHDVFVRLTGVHAHEELLALVQKTPEKEPNEDGPDEEPKDQPETPAAHPGPEIPEAMAQYIKHRSGFSNYYFNELHRTRVWNAFIDNVGDFAAHTNVWRIEGSIAGGGNVRALLSDASTIESAGGKYAIDPDKDLAEQLSPPGSGGLLATLQLWRRMLVEGPRTFGEVYYLGTAPLLGRDELADCFVASFDVVEARFYFDSKDGTLLSIQMMPDTEVDPCEIRFSDYREVSGLRVPHRWIVRHGDELFAEIEVRRVDFAPAAANNEAS